MKGGPMIEAILSTAICELMFAINNFVKGRTLHSIELESQLVKVAKLDH